MRAMPGRCRTKLVWVLGVLLLSGVPLQAEEKVLLREEFTDLDGWEPLVFDDIDRHTTYSVDHRGGESVLVAVSDDSASALINRETFSVADYPIIRWRWQVDTVYERGDYRTKQGDDYPLRVYVVFAYDPETAPLGMKITYELAKTFYGEYPPHSSVNYIWANQAEETEPVFSPYTDRSIMIPLQSGPQQVGRWVEQQVNVYEDYRTAFGEPPPSVAAVAVMNDSDNTGEAAVSYLDYIEIRKQ
jgi:hypothetical protein